MRLLREWLTSFIRHLRSVFDTELAGRLMLCSPLVGILAGLAAAAFYYVLINVQTVALGDIEGYYPPVAGTEAVTHAPQLPIRWWAVLLVPTAGGLICGLLVHYLSREAEGHGTDAMLRAFHQMGGRIRSRVPLVKAMASIATIGTGGSAGREGPIAQIGAGLGALLADPLGLSERERRLLMLAGGAGGIGAIFQAPLGGALFVSEVLYSSAAVEAGVVVPAVISSVTAYTVFSAIYGPGLAFSVPSELAFHHARELPFYVLLSLLCALVASLYISVFYGSRDLVFRRLPIPAVLKPALGGLGLGALALMLPQVMGGGYGWIQRAIDGELTTWTLLILCLAKIVATSTTISSGGSGGVFAPSLFIGAMLGGWFGRLCEHFFPQAIDQPEAFVLVGMGAFFAGAAKVPLTAILMVCEMSGSYGLLIPLMLTSILHVALLSSRWTLYEEQVHELVDSPAHQGDFAVDVLEQLSVAEVMSRDRQLDLIPFHMPLPDILRVAAASRNNYFPVVDAQQRLVGIFSLRDLRSVLTGQGAGSLVVALDVASTPVLTVTPDDDLHTALRRFTQKNIDDLPVVESQDPQHVIGFLSRKDLIAAYHDRLSALQARRK